MLRSICERERIMVDYSELVKRLRGVNWICHIYGKTEVLHDTVCHEAADAIEAQAKRIEELEKDRLTLWKHIKELHENIAELEAKLSAKLVVKDYGEGFEEGMKIQALRIEKLEAALKPFAYYAEQIPNDVSDTASASGTVGDLRTARKVLGEK